MSSPLEPFHPRLDLPSYVGQRAATFIFTVFNNLTGERKGTITPLRNTPAALSHDTTRTIKRTLSLTLANDDANFIDPIADRINVAMVIDATSYPLGDYLITGRTDHFFTSGVVASLQLADLMFIIDQKLTFGYSPSNLVSEAVRRLLLDFPQVRALIDTSPFTATGSWAAGTSRASVINSLATQGGYFSPWFGNDGIFRMIRAFDPTDADFTIDFDDGRSVIRDSIANESDLLTAPNRFVVIGNWTSGSDTTTNSAGIASVGTYDIPASAPNSIANRGFVIADVKDIQVASNDQAFAAAKAIGIASTVFQRVTLNTPADPRHDSYDVIRWQGQKWLELAWTMNLAAEGAMSHTLRTAFK